MIKAAKQYPVSDIFKFEANIRYLVPKYQREYTWSKAEWEDLFDDIWENDKGHFLGSIICINRTVDAHETQELEVVDGQQRLATLSLLYAAIYCWLNQRNDLDADLTHDLGSLHYRIILKHDKSKLKFEPSYQQSNFQDYCVALKGAGFKVLEPKVINVGNRRIMKAYRYFTGRLEEKDEKEKPVFDTNRAKQLLEKVDAAFLVKIEAETRADAFRLFESLNNRGVPLSAMDLIKNKLLADLEKLEPKSIDENFAKWKTMIENLTDNYAIQQRFLRQYYNAFKFKPWFEVKGISRATRSNLVDIFQSLIEDDPTKIFEDLQAKAAIYNRLIDPSNESNSSELNGSLQDLERISGAPSFTLLLYLASLDTCSDDELTSVVEFLVRYFVRRNLTDVPPTRDLDTIFIDLIVQIEASEDKSKAKDLMVKHLLDPTRCASDDVFRTKLSGKIYDDNSAVARFVLCRLEEDKQTREKQVDLWALDDNGRTVFTVEHIFPQGDNIPQSWVDMIAGGDVKKAKEIRSAAVHKLGNLTLSGYNSRLSNLSYIQKRDRTDQKKNHVGYRNGLSLNKLLQEKETWTLKDIETRTTELVEEAMTLFRLSEK